MQPQPLPLQGHRPRRRPVSYRIRLGANNLPSRNGGKMPIGTQSIRRKHSSFPLQEERRSIDEENRRQLTAMSPAQIEKERADLISALSSSSIQRLLRRVHIDEEPPLCKERESTAQPKKHPTSRNRLSLMPPRGLRG